MQDRTVNIILITKRFTRIQDVKEHIAKYMSEECDTPIETYTDRILCSIVRQAFFDYLWSASKERVITCIREFIEESRSEKDLDRMLSAMCHIQVAEKIEDAFKSGNGDLYHYIDGWHDTEFTQRLDKGEWT